MKNKYLPEKCVQVRTIGATSVCKEPAASTTGPSPYVKGGLSPISLPKLIHEFIQIIAHVNEIVRFLMHPIFFGLRRAGYRRLKSSTNTLFAAKSCIENSRGAVQIPRLEALSRRRLNNRIGMHPTKICRSQGNWTKLCMQRTRRKHDGSFTVR